MYSDRMDRRMVITNVYISELHKHNEEFLVDFLVTANFPQKLPINEL